MPSTLKTDPEAPVVAGAAAAPGDLAFVRDRRVGHLATADAAGTPSVVPVCYAMLAVSDSPSIVIAIDEKPKGDPRALQRVRNIVARPEVSLVVDDYSEDWGRLAWVLLRGRARMVEPGGTWARPGSGRRAREVPAVHTHAPGAPSGHPDREPDDHILAG